MERRTNERTYIHTNEQTDEQKSENYMPPHTSYVEGIITLNNYTLNNYYRQKLFMLPIILLFHWNNMDQQNLKIEQT